MDLPKSKFYGIRCAICDASFYSESQQQIELMCTVSFQDKGGEPIKTELGLLIGYGRFKHICRPELN